MMQSQRWQTCHLCAAGHWHMLVCICWWCLQRHVDSGTQQHGHMRYIAGWLVGWRVDATTVHNAAGSSYGKLQVHRRA